MDICKAHKNRKARAVVKHERAAKPQVQRPQSSLQQARKRTAISAVLLEAFLGEDDELSEALWTLVSVVSGFLALVVFLIWALS
jgi:hypothetical protein